MNTTIHPVKLNGVIDAMPSKSHAHRLLIARMLSHADGCAKAIDDIPSFSEDIAATKRCLAALETEHTLLDCGESGSTLRFLLPVAMAVGDEATFTGRGKLPSRPVSPLREEMIAHGCSFEDGNNEVIFKVTGRLNPGDFTLPGNVSSQYITGLLFALPLLDGDSRIRLTTPLESAGYVALTLGVIHSFGIIIDETTNAEGLTTYHIPGNQKYTDPGDTAVEGDWSNSAFWLVCGALGGDITCRGLNPESAQPDSAIMKLLNMAGASMEITELNGNLISLRVRGGNLHSIDCDVSQMPDIVPPLAVLLASAEGTSHISGIERLRIKESDRVASVTALLTSLGGQASADESTITIDGVPSLKGGTVNSFNDHRIAMAAAIASCLCDSEVTIEDSGAVKKSYPDFFDDFSSLGGVTETDLEEI